MTSEQPCVYPRILEVEKLVSYFQVMTKFIVIIKLDSN